MTAEKRLADAARSCDRAAAAWKAAAAKREAAIRAAHDDGMALREIARHARISHQRVAQILSP